MATYNHNNLDTYISSLNGKYGKEMTSDLVFRAMNFQADNVRLISLKEKNDINAREQVRQIFVCFVCSKGNEQRLIFLPTNNNKNVGEVGYTLSPFYQSASGSLKHSIGHIYCDIVKLNF